MNTLVTATGMQVKAKAEGGLLISATHADGSWSNTAQITLGKSVLLLPASTADGAAWVHAHSTTSNDAIAIAEGYYDLGSADTDPTATSHGSIKVSEENLYAAGSAKVVFDDNDNDNKYNEGENNTSDDGFYLVTDYYLRSSGTAVEVGSAATYKALAINKVRISTVANSATLDKSLRIGIQFYDTNGTTKIGNFVVLAPVNGADGKNAAADATAVSTETHETDKAAIVGLIAPAGSAAAVTEYYPNVDSTFIGTIPANTAGTYITARVYVWFEGEDATCYSDAITTQLDTLSIEISFKITNVAGQYAGKPTISEPAS